MILPFSVIDLKHSCLPIPGAYRIKGRFVYKLNNKLIEGIYVDMQETTYKVNLRSYMTCISMICNNIICISNVCLFKRNHAKPSESKVMYICRVILPRRYTATKYNTDYY